MTLITKRNDIEVIDKTRRSTLALMLKQIGVINKNSKEVHKNFQLRFTDSFRFMLYIA